MHWSNIKSDDVTIKSSRTVPIPDVRATIVELATNTLEDPQYQPHPTTLSILYENIPDSIQLLPDQNEAHFVWITVAQTNATDIEAEFRQIHLSKGDLLSNHTNEWAKLWTEMRITAKGNNYLSNAIQASQFALLSSLPSLNRFQSKSKSTFYGLSPAGLGLDRTAVGLFIYC